MSKVQSTSVSAATQVENKKVKKQQQKKEQQVFKGNGNKQTVQKPNDSAIKQKIYKKTGFQLKDTANRGKIIPLKVNGKVREYETVGTLTTGGRILVKERGKEVYHVVSHTKDNKLVMLKDDYAKNKIFYESTSSEHKVKYGKKNYVITNSKRDRHGRMSAIDENGKRVVLSSDGKELKTGYVEAEDQKDNMNDYIAKQTKGKSKAEADKIRQQILSGNSSYSNKGVLRFKASNGEVWYYDTKRKTYVKYAEKEAQAIIKNLDKGATENWLLFRTGLGTDYELLKNTNAQIIDPEVLNKVNKHYSAEYGNKVDKNAQYGSGKYKTAYEAFLASEIGDDEVYQFNAALVKNNAITDQSRRNEILQTNLTKIKSNGLGVSGRANRLAAADAASTKEDYQALQDAAEEELKKTNYKAPFKGSDALQTYIYGVNNGDVQEIDDFNTTLIDPKEDMLDRDEIVRIKAETGVLWAKKGLYNKAFESQDSDVTKQMFALQSSNGKSALDAKLLKKQAAEKHQDDYLMMARPDLYSEDEIVTKATKLLQGALQSFKSYEDLHYGFAVKTDNNVMQLQATETNDLKTAENLISRAYSLISNNSILSKVKAKMGDNFNVLMKKEDAHFKTNSFKNVTSITDKQVTEYSDKEGKVKLTPEQIAHNKYVVTWLKSQLADLERDKKLNEAKDGWKQDFVNWHRETYSGYATRSSVANKYQLIKSNIARLEAAAEGKLVDASGKPVSFEDAMKNLGETGIQALEHANADYQTAQQTGEFMVDMAVLALPLPKGFNAANTVIKMGNALYRVISKSDKACKVIKITQEAIKGSKIYEVATNVATKNPKFVENARKVATIMDSSATGAMHMAGKTVVLDASNIATSREGFTSDRISEMNQKTQSAAVFGGMGGAIGGTTAVASEFVSSAGAKYTVHGVGLVADLMGAAGLMTAESHGETNFWDNLRCVNPDGSFNFEQASMTAMMIFGHLHGMSAVRGKVKPPVELQADGTVKGKSTPKAEIQADDTVKYTLNNRELVLSKDGIFTDSETGRKFKLAKNKNGKAELVELTKKEVAARHSEVSAEESRGTSTQQIKSFKERINNAKTREELNAIRSEIKKTDLTVQERNELMAESLKVQREWGQAPERRQIVNMATEGEASVMGKPELTALRQEVGIKQSKPGLHFEGETDGANTIINEMKGNDTVNSYIVSRDVEGKAHIEYKVSYENGKATDVEIYNADGTIKELPAETKQAVLDELNKPAETDSVSHSEAPVEESRVNSESHSEAIAEESRVTETSTANDKNPVIASESEAIQPKPETNATSTESNKPSLNVNDKRIQETMTIEDAKKLAEQYDNVKVTEYDNGSYEIKVTDENGDSKTTLVKNENDILPLKSYDEIVEIDSEGNATVNEFNKNDLRTKYTKYDSNGKVEFSNEFEYDNAGNKTKTTKKDANGKITEVLDGDGNPLKTESSQPATEPPVIGEESRGADSNQSANVEPKAGKKFKLSTDDIPTKLSDMQEFVEKNSLNALSFKVDDNTILYSIKNDETGGVMHVQFTDGKRSNMTIVKANDLQTYIEFAEDGVTLSKVRTDFIDNDKIFTRVEDKTTGQVTFEEPVVMNGKRSPAGLAIENDSPIAKRFSEGTIDLEGKFTPKGVNEDANMGEEVFSPYEVIEQNAGKPTKTALKDGDGNVLEYNYNEYDSNGNVAKTTSKDATGKVIASHEFEYDSSHNLTKETVKDAEGKITGIYDGKGKEISESKTERKSVVEESQATGEQKQSSLILPGDERKPVKIKTAEEFAKEENKPVQIKTEEEFAKEDRTPVQIKTEEEFAKEDSKPVQIKTEEEFAKEDGHVEIDSSNTTTEEVAKQPIKLDLDTKSSRGDIDAKSHYEVMADKVIVDGEEFPIPQTLEEAKNTKALRYWGGGNEYSIEYTSDFANSTNRVILKYDTESGKFIGSTERLDSKNVNKDILRNADGTIDYTLEYLKAENEQVFEVYRDSNGKPTSIYKQGYEKKKIIFDKEGKASYEVTNEKNETINKPIEEAFKDYPELKPLLKKQGIKLVEKTEATGSSKALVEESQGQKEPLTKESLEKDIEALKQGDDVSEYLGKLDEAKKQGVLNDDEVYELTQKATKKVSEVEISEPENTPEEFPENPTKPKQLEKKTIEEILGDEQAPKTADEAKKYAEEHEDAEFVASDDPNNCDMLFLDKEQNNIIYYNKDGVQAYREYNPSEAIEQRDTSLYSDGTVYRVETRTVDGNLKVEAYDPVGNLKRKELYDTDNGVWALHEITFDSEGNMTGARKVVQNRETGTWEGATEYKYEYNAEKNRFEQKNEKDEVVSTVKYDAATEHWAEFDAEGKAIHEINKPESVVVEPTPVEEHQGVIEIESSTGEPTPVGENSENNPASEKVEKRNSDGTKIPKKFRGRDDVTYDPMTKTYTEITEMYGVTTESIYDSKGRLLQEVEGNQTKYYNPKGEVIAEQEITDHGIKRTEKSKDYDLDVLFNSLGEGEKITIKYHEDKKGNAAEPEEFTYNKDSKVFENKGPEGTVFKTVEYDAKNHKWTIKDAEGKKIDSQNNMKESHIKRNIGIGAGVLALGGGIYGVSKLVKSDDDKEVKQPAKPTAKQTPKKTTPAPKAETKVTLDGKEGTIAEDGTLILDGKKYPKDTDGTYTIGDKKYKVEDGKLVEVVDTPDDNGETGGAAPDESPEVKGTIDGKEYTIKDGKVSVDGAELTPDENGHYKIGDDKYKIEDGKLVKVEPEEPAKTDTGTDAAQSDDSQAGGGRTGGSASGTTGSQGGGRTGGSASGTTGSQGDGRTGGSASGTTGSQGGRRTGGSTSGNTGATHNDTSRPVTTPRSEQSEESRHTGNTPVTDVTDPTEAQKQVAKTLQDEISGISTQADVKAFFTKLTSAVKNGQITIMQSDELLNLVNVHVETLVEVARAQNEQDAIQKPEFGLGEVTTPQEPQPKEKREITPVERMDLTEKIRKATDRNDIEKIQQEMRQYKVFPGRKNLRRAYKAKLRAIKHQDEPQKVEKYNEKFKKRMEKIENSKVYEQDSKEILYKIDKKMWDSENFYT